MALQHRFVAGVNRGAWSLASRVDGKDAGRRDLLPQHPWLAPKQGVLGHLHGAVARALRTLGYMLLGSPLLVVVYLVLLQLNAFAAGLVVVAFVCTAAAFFATLNAFIVLAAIRYAMTSSLTLRLWPKSATDEARALVFAQTSPSLASADEPTTARGEVVLIGAPADANVVLRDVVSRPREVRVLEACDFALYTDNGEYVVVRLEDAPLLLADREKSRTLALPEGTRNSLAERGITNPARERSLRVTCVRVGDRVSVVGFPADSIDRVDRFELGGELRGVTAPPSPAVPYRGARGDSAMLLRCTQRAPMLVVHEGGP
jgi:hypothetical protein